jgi:hypothetical protein
MSPKRGDAVAPPPRDGEWQIRYANNDSAKGWAGLEQVAATNLWWAWDIMRTDPGQGPGKPTSRHFRLRGDRATASHGVREMAQWQIEVTSGGRIWYLLDEERHTVWVKLASPGRPKATD